VSPLVGFLVSLDADPARVKMLKTLARPRGQAQRVHQRREDKRYATQRPPAHFLACPVRTRLRVLDASLAGRMSQLPGLVEGRSQ
jgi:hypothetical protein